MLSSSTGSLRLAMATFGDWFLLGVLRLLAGDCKRALSPLSGDEKRAGDENRAGERPRLESGDEAATRRSACTDRFRKLPCILCGEG